MKAATRRKLVDIKAPVFEVLSSKAKGKNVSLKRYIENLLHDRSKALDEATGSPEISPAVFRLVGSALPLKGNVEDIADDRLKYILSK